MTVEKCKEVNMFDQKISNDSETLWIRFFLSSSYIIDYSTFELFHFRF